MAWIVAVPPSPRHPRKRWKIVYRDQARRERSAGIYGTEPAARAVKRRVERGDTPHPQARTILAEHHGQVVGLAHNLLGEDAAWGALIDNLHVFHALKDRGSAPGC